MKFPNMLARLADTQGRPIETSVSSATLYSIQRDTHNKQLQKALSCPGVIVASHINSKD